MKVRSIVLAAVLTAAMSLAAGCGGDSAQEQPTTSLQAETTSTSVLEVKIWTRLAYKTDKYMDVYAPTAPGPWPIVVAYHGYMVDRNSLKFLARNLAGQGVVVFVPNWAAGIPDAATLESGTILEGVEDQTDAVRFARAHASEYGADPGRVVAAGHSAGGATALVVTLAGDRFPGELADLDVSPLPDAYVGLDAGSPYGQKFWWASPYNKAGQSLSPDIAKLYELNPEVMNSLDWWWLIANVPPRQGVELRFFMGEAPVDETEVLVADLNGAGWISSAVALPYSHDRMAKSTEETVSAILELARGK